MSERHMYTEEEIDFLRNNAKGMSHEKLWRMFNKHFGLEASYSSLCTTMLRKGIYCRAPNAGHHKYTDEQLEFLRTNRQGRSSEELTAMFNEKFGLDFSVNRVHGFCKSKGWRNSNKGNYSEEEIEFMKATTDMYIKDVAKVMTEKFKVKRSSEAIQLKLSKLGIHRPHTTDASWRTSPIHAERTDKKGTVWVKVIVDGVPTWRQKSRLVLEERTGCPIPKGLIVIHADGDRTNFDLDNLLLFPGKYRAYFSHNGWWDSPPEIKRAALRWCEYVYALKDFGVEVETE